MDAQDRNTTKSVFSKKMASGKRIRVIIYTRYSTEDQDKTSNEAQELNGREWLDDNGLQDAEITVISDEAISGEILDRPGINRVRDLIEAGAVDLLIAEEVSRFFRDRSEPHKLAGECVDAGVRMVTLHDHIDTNLETWEKDIAAVSQEYAATNEKTSFRIRRAYRNRWKQGYAMSAPGLGYVNVPVDQEDWKKTGRGPYRLAKIPECGAIIEEIFLCVARGESLKAVAQFITQSGLKKSANSSSPEWTDRNVLHFIQDPIYKGSERFGVTHSVKHHGSGVHKPTRTDDDKILTREMPHLAFVSSVLWQQANDAIDSRNHAGKRLRGRDNPHYRVPRNSRTPLSGHFFCGICRGKMYGLGRDGGGYRCANALKGLCWNKATVVRDVALKAIENAVSMRLQALDGFGESVETHVREIEAQDGEIGGRLQIDRQNLVRVNKKIDDCRGAILKNPDIETYADVLREYEADRRRIGSRIESAETVLKLHREPIDAQIIRENAKALAAKVLQQDEGRNLIKMLTTPIYAVPFKRVDCGLVVLRARFDIRLAPLIPAEWEVALNASGNSELPDGQLIIEGVEVDLFENPVAVRFAGRALEMYRQLAGQKKCGERIAQELGISRRCFYDALYLAQFMEREQIKEPYTELREPPKNAARWGKRKT